MKKHNESKSIKGISRSKGKAICKVISFTMIFVMLFCISGYSLEEEYTELITVKNQNNETISIQVNVDYIEEELEEYSIKTKRIKIDEEFVATAKLIAIEMQEEEIAYYVIGQYSASNSDGYYETGIQPICMISNINFEDVPEEHLEEYLSMFSLITAEYINGEENITQIIPTSVEEISEYLSIIESYGQQIKTRTDYSEIITIIEESPAYEGFIGNARGLFDMIFESMQSIFNWFVSPNVIVFFGLGIILSLTTIGILIARRFFWGR